ncbi:MAG TPA: S1 RNA-binding domain-containing protein [Polyangiaceae bacterium]|nr:S1 RNA-binding domain-containing protein [Polyangiaceae bacterium]
MMAQTPTPLDGQAPPPPSSPSEHAAAVAAGGAPDETASHAAHADSSDAASDAAAAEASSADESADGDDGDAASDGSEGAEGAGGDAAKAGADGAKKKRRRKRSKKKPGAAADGAAAPSRPPARPASERSPFHAGEEVFGRVTAVLDGAIMVDLAGKALAIFDRSEMEQDDLVPAVGDRFVASVLRDGSRGGLVVLTRKPLREEAAKALALEANKSGTLVKGLITGVIKGGVEVSLGGLRAFAPASGMDLHPQNANFASLLGQVLDFKVTQCDEKARDVVVTRRPMLEAEAHERRKTALKHLTEGQVLKGTVRTVVEWGAFVALSDAGGLEGLVHVSEASHDPKAKIGDLFKPGDEFDVKITKIDERGKIWLSRRALLEDPWAEARGKYAVGKTLKATISRLEPFGAFVKLDDDIDGLIHVTDLMAAPQFGYKKIEHPREVVAEGQEIEVVISHFDIKNRKVTLHVALPEDKRGEAQQKIAKNNVVQAEVVRGEAAGLIVRILGVTGRSSRGFIPAGQTGTARGTDLRKKFKEGTPLTVKVIDVDPRRMEPKLSIKQAAEDEERRAHREYRKQLAKDSGFGTLGDLLAKLK